MIKLGIIGAMEVEIATITQAMTQKVQQKVAGMDVYQGLLGELQVVVARCGVGKVHAALCVQVLCDCFGVTHLLNTGIAGALHRELSIGDLVISSDAMYHDFDCCAFGYPKGKVPGMPTCFPADKTLHSLALAAAEQVCPGHVRTGRVASGDQFVCSNDRKKQIVGDTQALCTEMEGAAIAHAAFVNGLPFVIIRAISDQADGAAEMDYPTFEATAARQCAAVSMRVADLLAAQQ